MTNTAAVSRTKGRSWLCQRTWAEERGQGQERDSRAVCVLVLRSTVERPSRKLLPMAHGLWHYLLWCSQHLANFENRVNFTGPGEKRPEGVHLCHDAAHCPDINGGAVVGRPQEYFWSPIPEKKKLTASYCFYWSEGKSINK